MSTNKAPFTMPKTLQNVDWTEAERNAIIAALYEMDYNREDIASAFNLSKSGVYNVRGRIVKRGEDNTPVANMQTNLSGIKGSTPLSILQAGANGPITITQTTITTDASNVSTKTTTKATIPAAPKPIQQPVSKGVIVPNSKSASDTTSKTKSLSASTSSSSDSKSESKTGIILVTSPAGKAILKFLKDMTRMNVKATIEDLLGHIIIQNKHDVTVKQVMKFLAKRGYRIREKDRIICAPEEFLDTLSKEDDDLRAQKYLRDTIVWQQVKYELDNE